MNGQKKLIEGVQSFSPTRENWAGKPSESLPGRLTLQFESGQAGSLDLKDPLSALWAKMIDRQTQAHLPVYVEIDEETKVITDVLIPHIYTVEMLETDDRGNLLVHLHQSQAIHAVLPGDPNFEAMRDSLQAAVDDGSERLITATWSDLEIIDVRLPPEHPGGSESDPPAPEDDPPVSPDRAEQIFNDMYSYNCVACNPSSDCISFQYPNNGCQIRAHLMVYKMHDYDPPETPEKLYIQGSGGNLDPFVPNHPDCRLPWGWGWHIAPTLMVTLDGGDEKHVIDPSLASVPVTVPEWIALNNPTASHTIDPLDWTVYNPRLDNTATEAQAQADMEQYRELLQTNCLTYGPPPYSCVKRLFFIMDRNNISDDEVEAMLLGGSPAHFSDAFYIVLEGYRPDELGFTEASLQHEPSISLSSPVSGMTPPAADRIEFEYPTFLNRHQRLTWVYNIDFTDTTAFTDPRRTITLEATLSGETGIGILYLIQQQNPYEIDGEVSWLSTDLRVFQIRADQSRFGANFDLGPNQFISDVIDNLNTNSAGESFEDISTDQYTSRLELSETVDGTAVYNFAVARVRYRSLDRDADNVRVFFRLFPWETSSVEYNQGTGYRRYQSGDQVVPLLGKKDNDVTAIPCFASPRINSEIVSMEDQTDIPNVQTLPLDAGGAEVHRYFGCWLDTNQTDAQFPLTFPATDIDGPYSSGRLPIQDHIRGEHQCLVAEIAFLPAPAQNGSTPANSDKLAQRNLAIVDSANPGLDFSRRIPQTFEIQPSQGTLEHDELMIDWVNVPVGSTATVHLPGFDSREILTLASAKYRHHRMKRIDRHTIRMETGGITYLPIPFADGSFPGMLTIDLPEGVKEGDAYKVLVRQVSGIRPQHDLRRASKERFFGWRHIVGSFQLSIPVRKKADMLPAQQRLLSNLRWIERAIPAANRWTPVFNRYVSQIADRVDALGGDSSKVAPSADGQWQQAYTRCRLLSLICSLLLAVLLIGSGTQSGGVVVIGGIPVLALLAGSVSVWRKKCRPTLCQLLRSVLAGSAVGAVMLFLIALFGLLTSQLIGALIVSVLLALAAAIASWVKGCFR